MPGAGEVYAVLMAGGSGTRFWPLSRTDSPKQLLSVLGGHTMLQATVARLQPMVPPERILVITTEHLADGTRAQLPMLAPEQVIAEPVGRDTAPCVALATSLVRARDAEATMIVLPADHLIEPADAFQDALRSAVASAGGDAIVTFGIEPTHPSSAYGYIELGESETSFGEHLVHRVNAFKEKPDEATARAYLDAGNYRWNSGIFVWRAETVWRQLERHCSWLTAALGQFGEMWGRDSFAEELARVYPGLEKISVDYALLEHAESISCIVPNIEWDDLGSWDALYDHLEADGAGVRRRGKVVAEGCRDSLLWAGDGLTVAAVDCAGLTVVAHDGAVLVCPGGSGQEVKRIVERLGEEGREDLL